MAENVLFEIVWSPYNVYRDVCPDVKRDKWEEFMMPHNLYQYMFKTCMIAEEKFGRILFREDSIIRLNAADNGYLKWIEEKEFENSGMALKEYAKTMPPEKTMKILKEHHMDYACWVNYIVVGCANPYDEGKKQTAYKLTPEAVQAVSRYLEKVHGIGNAYVPGYILNIRYANQYIHEIQKDGWKYFVLKDGAVPAHEDTRHPEWDIQKHVNPLQNIVVYFIPYVICNRIKTNWITHEKLLEAIISACPDAYDYREYDIGNVRKAGMEREKMEKEIAKCFVKAQMVYVSPVHFAGYQLQTLKQMMYNSAYPFAGFSADSIIQKSIDTIMETLQKI